ncbi:MAG: hypothetical protein WDA71_00490 [Actinomycetota bacterium]
MRRFHLPEHGGLIARSLLVMALVTLGVILILPGQAVARLEPSHRGLVGSRARGGAGAVVEGCIVDSVGSDVAR